MTTNETLRRSLNHERSELVTRIAALQADDDALAAFQTTRQTSTDPTGGDGDQTSVERAGIKVMMEALVDRLAAVESALGDETYGMCGRCGSAIPQERLEALPGVTTCMPCAG